jgi:hypothetical protein
MTETEVKRTYDHAAHIRAYRWRALRQAPSCHSLFSRAALSLTSFGALSAPEIADTPGNITELLLCNPQC